MGGPYHIRTAEPGDLARLVELEALIFPDPWTRGMLRGSLGPASLVAATPHEGVVAYALAIAAADVGELVNLAVHPEHRRGGVGRRLVEEVLRRLAANGVRSVYLEVREGNAAGRAFYGELGFREVGRRTGYYRRPVEDALVLERVLGAESGDA